MSNVVPIDQFNPEKFESLPEEQAGYITTEFSGTALEILGEYRDLLLGTSDQLPRAIVQFDAYSDAEEAQRD